MKHQLIIIGSGPAGLTAAIYAARANLKPVLIEGTVPGGQLIGTSYVENWPGIKKVLGPALMMDMQEHAKSLGTSFISETITRVNFSERPFKLYTDRNRELISDAIIIATGAVPNKLNIPGEADYWGKGVTTCAVCDGPFYANKKVVIVGGGDTAMENAIFLKKYTHQITIIQRGPEFTATYAMKEPVLQDNSIIKIFDSTLAKIEGNGEHVTNAFISNQKTGKTEKIEADGIFIAIGLKPSTEPFKGSLELDTWGYLVIHDETNTSIPGIFAAGDVSDFKYRQAIVAAGNGCKAALDAERYLKDLK